MYMFLQNYVSDRSDRRGDLDARRRFHVAVPLASKVGPISRILNHTCPEPSNVSAVPGALAI